jgi:hypothetical protein
MQKSEGGNKFEAFAVVAAFRQKAAFSISKITAAVCRRAATKAEAVLF